MKEEVLFWPTWGKKLKNFTLKFAHVSDLTWPQAFLRDGDRLWAHPNSPITCHLVHSQILDRCMQHFWASGFPLFGVSALHNWASLVLSLQYLVFPWVSTLQYCTLVPRSLMKHLDSALVPVVLVSSLNSFKTRPAHRWTIFQPSLGDQRFWNEILWYDIMNK